MKQMILIGLLYINIGHVFGQAKTNPINIMRYNDDFSATKTDSTKKGFNKLKNISLGKQAAISFGGELREQYQYFENLNFGDVPPNTKKISVGQVWHRVMLHSNIEIGKKVRVFAQLNSTFRFFNPNPITPEIDENRLSLHQAFIDYKFTNSWLIRAGRQELGYGNNRLLTFREGPNTRLTFDAAIIKHQNKKRKIDFLAITPVISNQFAFDDKSFKEFVFGFYATENVIPKKLLLDYYFLHFTSENRRYNFATGKENRNVGGFRIFSQNAKLNYELESTYQFGKFGKQSIAAFGFSSDIRYVVSKKYNVELGLGANYFTGDRSRTDNNLNTYNLIFSKPSYGLAAPIGSSNIINVNPYVKFNPTKKLTIYSGVYFLQRQSKVDGTYSPGMAQLRPTPNLLFASSNTQIGTQYAIETNYMLNKHFSFAFDAAYFNAGKYVKETGKGKNTTYISAKAAFKF
jgi:hypothetical protein